jgi:transketolase
VDGFGMSAPADELAKHYGLTAPQVTERILQWASAKAKAKA